MQEMDERKNVSVSNPWVAGKKRSPYGFDAARRQASGFESSLVRQHGGDLLFEFVSQPALPGQHKAHLPAMKNLTWQLRGQSVNQ